MKFMIEIQLQAGAKEKAVEAFERQGPNRNPGVKFEGAWIGGHSDVAFVLVDGVDEAHVANAARSWSSLGQAKIHAVIDVQQY